MGEARLWVGAWPCADDATIIGGPGADGLHVTLGYFTEGALATAGGLPVDEWRQLLARLPNHFPATATVTGRAVLFGEHDNHSGATRAVA